MFAVLFHRRGSNQQFIFRHAIDRNDLREAWLAFGERAGFVHDDGGDLLHDFHGFRIANQHARLRAAPDADHDGHRRGESERARTRDDEHGDRVDDGMGEARFWTEPKPKQ